MIEVSDSTLIKDMRFKRDLYAHGGVEEYWVVDVDNLRMHVFRTPQAGVYSETRILAANESIAPAGYSATRAVSRCEGTRSAS